MSPVLWHPRYRRYHRQDYSWPACPSSALCRRDRHERKGRESNRPGGQSADLALVQRIEQLPRRLPFLCQEICRYHLRPERGCHDQWQPDIIGVVIAKRFYANSNVSWHYDRALNLLSNLIDFPHLQLRRK